MRQPVSQLAVDLGARVARRRRDRGFQYRELAAAAGLSTATLWCIERGYHEPMAGTVVRLCQALGCSPGWLLGTEAVEGP